MTSTHTVSILMVGTTVNVTRDSMETVSTVHQLMSVSLENIHVPSQLTVSTLMKHHSTCVAVNKDTLETEKYVKKQTSVLLVFTAVIVWPSVSTQMEVTNVLATMVTKVMVLSVPISMSV